MKAAFACWENRIAPVFDTARRIHVVVVESGRIVREGQATLPGAQPVRKALHLAESGIGTLVCGAISRPLHGLVSSHGIRVIPFVAGDLREIVEAWLGGNLRGDAFAMPGCRGRVRLRRFLGAFDAGKEGWNMPGNRRAGRGAGGGRGPGRGQGAGPGRKGPGAPPGATESAGTCVCYQCGHREPHVPGIPCRARVCPRCGGEMGRES